MGAVRPLECERARAWVSLGLDGELSEVEQALLRAHVGRCADCAGYARDLEGLTQELRGARLERPATELPWSRRRSAATVLRVGTAAAAVALAVGLGSVAGSLFSRGSESLPGAGPPAHQHLLAMADEAALVGTRGRQSIAL
jgi:predicted anti-sigma-YlaC factor YlaD